MTEPIESSAVEPTGDAIGSLPEPIPDADQPTDSTITSEPIEASEVQPTDEPIGTLPEPTREAEQLTNATLDTESVANSEVQPTDEPIGTLPEPIPEADPSTNTTLMTEPVEASDVRPESEDVKTSLEPTMEGEQPTITTSMTERAKNSETPVNRDVGTPIGATVMEVTEMEQMNIGVVQEEHVMEVTAVEQMNIGVLQEEQMLETGEILDPMADSLQAIDVPEPGISEPVLPDDVAASSLPAAPDEVTEAEIDDLFARTGLHTRLDEWHQKRYYGGYRDRRSEVEYFHAETQTPTPQEIRARNAPLKFHRDTQTKFLRNRRTQSTRESATQMTKPGCYVSVENDHILRPRRYISADEHDAWIISNVIKLQCWVRRVKACRRVARLRKERDERTQAMMEKERRRKELAEKRRRKEIESRLHPKTTKDFEILYNGLESWRQQETLKINKAGYSEPARLAALADLLDQEAALIQKIDRLKIAANEENRERKIVRLLEAMSSSKKWMVEKVGIVSVDTPNTIRARELRDLYHALNVPLVSVDERLQILLHVKYTVKEFDCNLTREIVELIDREGDLVSRGRDAKTMEGLRKRISNLFLQFIQTPEFNPEAGLYQKFPDAGQSWKRDQAVYYCRSCTRYLPSTAFYLSTTMKHLGKCKTCTTEENLATSRKDDSIYSDLLKLIRLQELQRRASSGVPTDAHYNAISLLQESDMRYLVDRVWNRQSAVSGSRALESLVLTRWNPNVELSPWNCILLTKAEAATHDRQPDPEELYSEEFVRKILQKHFAAKQHFAQLPAMEKYLRRHYVEDAQGKMVYTPAEGSVTS
ncbi:uncharacterized protein SPPG_04636 [Spizellomyces punctatus DAOM BR117]|uniref:IQ motif and ubiquitin-like domain-containing protein n=1 Tax=Spizellomyces punctatus (strain DAOM BR117) TaxID=645134 RepID=A0A0L0HFP7_SPIPD|nr:uncharacterized protein SPPG_04636 [Spizellomyces punctatus DAOM BR117]KND00311.1 hypothetical protein SPPG_04636 [Spizellomyces punctatus DAOM BR117]|eukprot:XP_016608350.1 hypothetical protein SPPG_04636 [Spizellomyces punctatus DAOM BR117]